MLTLGDVEDTCSVFSYALCSTTVFFMKKPILRIMRLKKKSTLSFKKYISAQFAE